MFGKVKKILGIEGVKMELSVPKGQNLKSEKITGTIKLTTQTESIVETIDIKLIEKYTRGRGEEMLIDEYVLGEITLNEEITIKSDEIIEVPFELEFVYAKSAMDKLADDNILLRGPIRLAKMMKKVKSSYKIIAEAIVKDTKLHPFAEISI